ncbi:MAG: lytic transglycosylase domain-containing protein [Candidatus Parabeggiatoa sp.]|nr:lytic transglycosylase domain-containing protein [Candidatus Parabeggiatoa sp.]
MRIRFDFIALASLILVSCASDPYDADQVAAPINHEAIYDLQAKVEANKKLLREIQFLATQAANRHGIDHRLFHALIKHESAWDPDALSPKGARGLTQIMPRTGETECGLERELLFEPELNLDCGAFYFSKLLNRFKNIKLALAAYNSGETRVARLGRVPRIRETQRYVKRVMASWRESP